MVTILNMRSLESYPGLCYDVLTGNILVSGFNNDDTVSVSEDDEILRGGEGVGIEVSAN